jgi:hypothetical protein
MSTDSAPGGTPAVRVVSAEDPEKLRVAIADAFDFRGDVSITRRQGDVVVGFVFDRRDEVTFEASSLRVLTAEGDRIRISYPDVAEIRFSGRDAAAGRSWETWVRRYAEKKLAGETASIESEILD